jgi:hypothetical protein
MEWIAGSDPRIKSGDGNDVEWGIVNATWYEILNCSKQKSPDQFEIVIHAQRSGCFELVAQRSLPSVIWVTTAIRSAWRNGLVRRGRVVGMPSVSA